MFSFANIVPVSEEMVKHSQLNKAILFEVAVARAEYLLGGDDDPGWDVCLQVAVERQARYRDRGRRDELKQWDICVADHAARNLAAMLNSLQAQNPQSTLEKNPTIPGLGWVATGVGDFSVGSVLVEVKHTNRNFISADFRQLMMYWMLKYAASIEDGSEVWSQFLLLNPRRNCALTLRCDYLLRSASASSSRVELLELLRSILDKDVDTR